jgi:hypothetical protein
MNKPLLFVLVSLFAVAAASSALGAGLLGQPAAELKQNQFGLDAEYSCGSFDLRVTGQSGNTTLKNIKSNMFIARPAYGLFDNLEVYLRLGGVNNQWLNDGYDFTYGFGTKATFYKKDEKLSWGVIFQFDRVKSKGDHFKNDDLGATDEGVNADMHYWEIVLAAGPTLKLAPQLSFYAGPYVSLIQGKMKLKGDGVDSSFNIKQKQGLGGFAGLTFDLCKNASISGEFQFSESSWLWGTSLAWKF